ncbi:zeta toxin family protein [Flavobacterium facile]|uniref:zeta toxin family protein n=1 Tax=Flavobacterium facile TaxID=2893174 RepID=UPI002E79A34F|nr:zeta toxin family protein [Flavobacterium sp. T-12]
MPESRLRIFAGPNGSGKSTLFDSFSKKYNAGVFLNADLIENELSTKGYIDLSEFNLNLTQDDLNKFLKTERAISLIEKSIEDNHKIDFSIKQNIIVDAEKETHSYEGALISSFLRHCLQENKIDFCFETVMSHPSKIEEIKEAKQKGYKTYLYFICIDDPEVNVSRVENRVEKGGHNVAAEKISSRYYNTLTNLIKMIENVDKCYLFDNSSEEYKLIAKITNNKLSLEIEPTELPNWFIEYVLKYYM